MKICNKTCKKIYGKKEMCEKLKKRRENHYTKLYLSIIRYKKIRSCKTGDVNIRI